MAESGNIVGGDAGEILLGGDGFQDIDGGIGNDLILGGGGNDVIIGFEGDDVISGGEGDDELRGHAGNDTVIGEDGNDLITGGKGNDVLWAGQGVDEVSGNDGDDIYIVVGDLSSYAGDPKLNLINTTLTGLLGFDPALDDSYATSDVASPGGVFNFSGLNETLHLFGDVDLTGTTLTGAYTAVTHSTLRLTPDQLNLMTSLTFREPRRMP